ncbi:MAG TPA: ABC transporter ATP-binding protein [Candidatus Binataceae bacterium]|nr:ABC transporter ATP-binding protein [Candidatus Binataceae bacterium]
MEELEQTPLEAHDWRLLGWILRFVRPYRGAFIWSLLLMPVNTMMSLSQPYLVKLTVDLFLARRPGAHAPAWLARLLAAAGPGHGLLVMGGIYSLLLTGDFLSFYGQFYLTMMVAQYSLSDLRLALFEHVQRLPMTFFDHNPVGRLVSRMTTDIDAINEMFASGSLTLLMDLLTLSGIAVIMFTLSRHLALWAMVAIGPLSLILRFFQVRARHVYRDIRERLAALNSYLSEAIGGMAIVQLFTRQAETGREFDQLNLKSRNAQMTANVYEAGLFATIEAVSSITIGLILWKGGGEAMHRLIGLGTLIAFFEYAQKFFLPLRDVSSKYTVLQSALVAAERLELLMREPVTIASPSRPRTPAQRRGFIEFDRVRFAYRPGEEVLKGLSFTIEPGCKVAIVGATGAGKTTIIKLLNRFYDVTGGRILVDGVDVREWELHALRRTIGLVQQDVQMFSGTILDNLRLGREELDEAAVRQALRRAQALDFVEALPEQLAQPLRERGSNLSAGQRQLLSFARALVYNPTVLVMDEATSSVDSETERRIQIALDALLRGRTALIIAHRLSTIERADRIMVMSHGELRESGSHEELLARRGLYYRLFELQYSRALDLQRASGLNR